MAQQKYSSYPTEDTKSSITHGTTTLEGRIPFAPGVLQGLIRSFMGNSFANNSGPDQPKLEVCTLEELCQGIKRKNMPADIQDRKQFAKIGQWTDPSGIFTIGLALTAGSEDPWQPANYVAHRLVAFLSLNGQDIYPHENKWSTKVQAFISESEDDTRQRGLIRDKRSIDFGIPEFLSEHPYMIHVNMKIFMNKLDRFHSVWQFSQCDVVYKIHWIHSFTRKPDVSGVRQVFDVPELTLLIAGYLDLRSIESLRQISRYFFNMQPLAAVGTTRLRHTLYRAFGGQRPEAQTNEIIKEFNALLSTTGGIIGGSTALSIMCPGKWLPADTDIVVGERHADAVEAFLTERIGLVFNEQRSQEAEDFYPGGQADTEDQDPAFNRDHIKFTYHRFDSPISNRPGVDLTIIHPRTIGAPADWVLTYHSTVVMNFWTGRTLHSLWPDLTINGKYLRNEYTPTPKIEAALQKYRLRGFTDVHATSGGEPQYLQDDYPKAKGKRLTIDLIPGPTWRKALVL